MKKILSSLVFSTIAVIVISIFAVYENSGATSSSSGTQAGAKSGAPAGGAAPSGGTATAAVSDTSSELSGSYVLDFLSPENAGNKTITIKDPKGKISGTWVCTEHGFQELKNVSYDGGILTFGALSGTPGDEYFYFHLDLLGGYLLGYAKQQSGHRSPIVGTPVK